MLVFLSPSFIVLCTSIVAPYRRLFLRPHSALNFAAILDDFGNRFPLNLLHPSSPLQIIPSFRPTRHHYLSPKTGAIYPALRAIRGESRSRIPTACRTCPIQQIVSRRHNNEIKLLRPRTCRPRGVPDPAHNHARQSRATHVSPNDGSQSRAENSRDNRRR